MNIENSIFYTGVSVILPLTNFTTRSSEAYHTSTRVIIDTINAGCTVLTGMIMTIIDIYRKKSDRQTNKNHQKSVVNYLLNSKKRTNFLHIRDCIVDAACIVQISCIFETLVVDLLCSSCSLEFTTKKNRNFALKILKIVLF